MTFKRKIWDFYGILIDITPNILSFPKKLSINGSNWKKVKSKDDFLREFLKQY